jgi:hypothetical protein
MNAKPDKVVSKSYVVGKKRSVPLQPTYDWEEQKRMGKVMESYNCKVKEIQAVLDTFTAEEKEIWEFELEWHVCMKKGYDL